MFLAYYNKGISKTVSDYKGGEDMPGEKELNITLFDQLTIVERIERQLENGGEEAAKKEIEIMKNEINRKLYQKPPLDGNK